MKFLACIFSLFFVFTLCAQPQLAFEKTTHDFGEIDEANGPAEFAFQFTNQGDAPIKITHVKASCGCTTPGWTKEEVKPGDTGYIKARYNPRNRPGKFKKSLRITTTDVASNQTLYIQGLVKPKPKTPEEQYPVVIGDFRLASKFLGLGKVTNEKKVTQSFPIYNASDSSKSIVDVASPRHIEVALVPAALGAGETGRLEISYDPTKKDDYGYVSDNIQIDGYDLSITATLQAYFPEMTPEELDRAPKLSLSARVFDFGAVTAGKVLETRFEIKNEGMTKLDFLAIKSNCDCVTYEFKTKALSKGKQRTLLVRFDTSDLRGNQYKSLSIYSNDPVKPVQMITLKAKVSASK